MSSGGRHVEKQTLAARSAGANFNSLPIHVSDYHVGLITITWSGLDAVDGSLLLEGSDLEDDLFCEIEGSAFVLDTATGHNQLELTSGFGYEYLRATYTANSVTAGTVVVKATLKNQRA